ncbi:hypothetical protein PG996_006342 [Apiospora saccharicola]|uniref:Ubiquitin-like protease family profile domain-containing protein n=1 Tax=Apiospora saccharicola TaxID=335842 RepID=A0ABR1VSX7_9PEZI
MGKLAKVQPSDDPGVRPEHADIYKRAMNGLMNLQLSSNNPVNLCAMDVVVDTLKKSLPKEVRSKVYCAPADGPDLWSDDQERCDTAFSRLESIAKEEFKPGDEFRLFIKKIALTPHVIWPLWVEDEMGSHWVLLHWHSAMVEQRQGQFPYIDEIRLFDPALDFGYHITAHKQNWARRARITANFARFLGLFKPVWAVRGVGSLRWCRNGRLQTDENGLMRGFHANFAMDVFEYDERTGEPAPEEGDHATGERCYAVVKQLLAGIVEQETAAPRDYYEPHREHLAKLAYVDPYLARIEMAGICAWKCLEARDFKARIGIDPLPASCTTDKGIPVLDQEGKGYHVQPEALARPDREYRVVTRKSLHRVRQQQLGRDEEELARQGGPPGPEGQNVRHRTNCAKLNPEATNYAKSYMGIFQSSLPKTTGITRKRSSSSAPEGEAHAKKARV